MEEDYVSTHWVKARLWKAPQAILAMFPVPAIFRGWRSTCMLKSPQGSPQVQISPADVRTQECIPPAAHWMTRRCGTHFVGAFTSLCSGGKPHWPYSFPPQAYAWPPSARARQCHPPIVTCVILVEPRADTLFGLRTTSCLSTRVDHHISKLEAARNQMCTLQAQWTLTYFIYAHRENRSIHRHLLPSWTKSVEIAIKKSFQGMSLTHGLAQVCLWRSSPMRELGRLRLTQDYSCCLLSGACSVLSCLTRSFCDTGVLHASVA